jgi:2-oxoglutarate ferredoxin oxidoreductase subunit gamma
MQTEIVISGFGGQGVLFAGQLLAYTAMENNNDVTWFPSYGPEMRGGTASCTVIVADEEIGSPIVSSPTAAVVMNLPSLEKYEPTIKPDGVLIVNSSMVDRPVERSGVHTVLIPATEIAETLGDKRMTNMVMLGGLLANLPVFSQALLEKVLRKYTPERHIRFMDFNLQALNRGAAHRAI